MLEADALAELRSGAAPFGVYVHVPWCASRCGYCDFNTYVPGHVRGSAPAAYAATAAAEARLMATALGDAARPADTVFVGGGTPTLLGAGDLAAVRRADALRFVEALPLRAYDVAFADPPYNLGVAPRLAERWLERPFAALLGVEHDAREAMPPGADTRRYGSTAVTFYQDDHA